MSSAIENRCQMTTIFYNFRIDVSDATETEICLFTGTLFTSAGRTVKNVGIRVREVPSAMVCIGKSLCSTAD